MTEESLDTIAVHTAADPDKNLGTLSTPVYQSAMFAFSDADQAAAISQGEQPGYSYGRKGNPTQTALETALRELEGGQAALATSSGMAAITATFISILKQGDHIIASQSLYAATNSLMEEIMAPLGIKVTYVDARNPDHYASVLSDRTKILFLESPANPILGLVDIEAAVQFGHDHDLVVVMDNTFATPYNQRPLELGVDLVIHSASKYLGGHGDLIAGGIVGDAELIHRIRWQTHHLLGGTIAPFTAWLVLRGIRTLALRMERHNANALAVAGYLEKHPKVDRVYYPGLPSHPQHELAQRQMRGFGGMVAFDVGGVEEGKRLVNGLKLCTLAVSLGNVETLIQHSASMTHATLPRDRRLGLGISDGLMRLSVGIEHVGDIIADLEQGLEQL